MSDVDLKDFGKDLERYLEWYEVGFYVEDKPRKKPGKGLKRFVGGVARPVKGISIQEMSELAEDLEERYKVFSKPLEEENEELNKAFEIVIEDYFDDSEQKNKNRVVNTMQAVIRNPILKGEYGKNSKKTIAEKGFDRSLIDTGQFFNSIKAEIDV